MNASPSCVGVLAAVLFAASAPAAQVRTGGQTFTLPDGFAIELVAGTNLVQRPVSASFDRQGRLYVTDSSGSNDKPSEQLKSPTHRILRLEDTDADGRFDKSVVFADKVMFPQGCLWHDGSVYMAGPPSIWKFTDTNDDGVADRREEWFKGGTLTGCANDIHGPHLGPDGYLYWTKGAFEEQTHQLGNGRLLKDRAAHIYRARADGTDLDVIMSGGMDNPVEVAFTSEGEAVFTSTFIDFSQPGYRDGIGHAIYGGVFGKVNGVLDDGKVKRTGPHLMQPFAQLGASAPSGLCRYGSTGFGTDYRDNLFATSFNLHKVTRHVLRPHGATYASVDSDFAVSDSLDFHPTDVLEDADGSMLIVDTGGWYKLCCPSSQLAKADVLGGIYRVRRTGARLLAGKERTAGYQQLLEPPVLRGNTELLQAKQASWKRDANAVRRLRELLAKNSAKAPEDPTAARLARVSAEALGRLGDKNSVTTILSTIGDNGINDPALAHSLTYALIEIVDAETVRRFLVSDNIFVRRAALIALDQMDGGGLKPEEVLPNLASSATTVREAALWIAGRHPNWGGALAGFFRERLGAVANNDTERTELARQMARFARSDAIQELIAKVAGQPDSSKASRLTALSAISFAGLKEPSPAWYGAVTGALGDRDRDTVRQSVAAARVLPPAKTKSINEELRAALEGVVADKGASEEVRLDAMAAVPGGLSELDEERFNFLLGNLASTRPVAMRNASSSILARSRLSEAQLLTLADLLKTVGPLEISRLLPIFQKVPSEVLGMRVLAALRELKGGSAVRPEILRPSLTNFPPVVQQQGEELLASLNVDAAKQKEHLEGLLAAVHGQGDVRRGQSIFNSAKAACSACHAIGYLGGKVGPDLTSIGQSRSERDLLEAIVYPSASFVRSYEPILVVTKAGDEHSGVLRRDGAEEILIATGPASEVQIPRAEIVEMRPGTVSVMPQGLDEQLSREELADLVAFLKNTRWGPQ